MIPSTLIHKSLAGLTLGMMLALPAVHAADWQPERPITMIVPSTAGAGADTTARLFSDRLATALGQPVVVDNRGGAGGLIGTNHAANSAPDGYTLILARTTRLPSI
ncbi:MAG: Bug family tripartite tricarboxylate transporter substrate binding protein, partial [Pigmentiphaga sp.]